MKKLTVILVLLMSIASIAQTPENRRKTQMFVGNATYYADSLWQDYTGMSGDDSTWVQDTIRLNYQYEWFNLTAIDTGGAGITDTIVVEYGIPTFTLAAGGVYTVTDTTWARVHFMRDSTWTNINLIAADGANSTVKIHVADYDCIRVRLANANVVAGRVWKYRAQAVLKSTN